MAALVDAAKLAYQGPKREPISRETVAKIPYASMGAAYRGEGEALVVLAKALANGDLQWVSASGEVLLTRGGRLVRTDGLVHNLAASFDLDDNGIASRLSSGKTGHRRIDLQPGDRFGLGLVSRVEDKGTMPLTHLDEVVNYRHVVEHCRVDLLDWSFENHFWLDPESLKVRQSVQYFDPDLPPLVLKVYTPYRGS